MESGEEQELAPAWEAPASGAEAAGAGAHGSLLQALHAGRVCQGRAPRESWSLVAQAPHALRAAPWPGPLAGCLSSSFWPLQKVSVELRVTAVGFCVSCPPISVDPRRPFSAQSHTHRHPAPHRKRWKHAVSMLQTGNPRTENLKEGLPPGPLASDSEPEGSLEGPLPLPLGEAMDPSDSPSGTSLPS